MDLSLFYHNDKKELLTQLPTNVVVVVVVFR